MPIALPVALLVGSAIAGGASVASGVIGSNAAGSAADKQAAAAAAAQANIKAAGDKANTQLVATLNQEQQALSPYVAQGTAGLNALTTALAPGGALTQQFSFDPSQIANNPAYQFQQSEGQQAVQRAAAAAGTLNSGGTLKALDKYSQGVASSFDQQYYNQALNTYNTNRNAQIQNIQMPLSIGQAGTNDLLSALQNYGTLFSQNTLGVANQQNNYGTQGANAQAAGTIGQANAYTGALGSLANIAQMLGLASSLGIGGGGSGNVMGGPAGSATSNSNIVGGLGTILSQNPGAIQYAPSAFTQSTNLGGYGSYAGYSPQLPGGY